MEKIYDRTDFIDSYVLTYEEFYALPEVQQLEYTRRRFGYRLDQLQTVGDSWRFAGFMDTRYYPFFELSGCKIMGFDGTLIIRTEMKYLPVSDDAKNKLEYYINMIAQTKAKLIEERIHKKICEVQNNLNFGIIFDESDFDFKTIIKEIQEASISSSILSDEEKQVLGYMQIINLVNEPVNVKENFLKHCPEYREIIAGVTSLESPIKEEKAFSLQK